MLQLWRNMHCFLAANVMRKDSLLAKITLLNNKPKESDNPVKVSTFREVNGLLMTDYLAMGDFVLQNASLTTSSIMEHLKLLRRRRLAYFHVFSAPDDAVAPSMSMLVHAIFHSPPFFFSNLRDSSYGEPVG